MNPQRTNMFHIVSMYYIDSDLSKLWLADMETNYFVCPLQCSSIVPNSKDLFSFNYHELKFVRYICFNIRLQDKQHWENVTVRLMCFKKYTIKI